MSLYTIRFTCLGVPNHHGQLRRRRPWFTGEPSRHPVDDDQAGAYGQEAGPDGGLSQLSREALLGRDYGRPGEVKRD